MKNKLVSLCILLMVLNCHTKATQSNTQQLSIAQKIANAHGFKHWNTVTKVMFTFAVDRDTIKGKERSWTWLPKQDYIGLKTEAQNISFSHKNLDSTTVQAHRTFINDKFWLLVPFQLLWDTNATISEAKTATAPISKLPLQMITIKYPEIGGYTPGDAYDIFFDDTYMLKEWTFRKGNSNQPTLSTTFEDYKSFNGIKIATSHKQNNGKWNLKFTTINFTVN